MLLVGAVGKTPLWDGKRPFPKCILSILEELLSYFYALVTRKPYGQKISAFITWLPQELLQEIICQNTF